MARYHIVAVDHRTREDQDVRDVYMRVTDGTELELERERTNRFDRNAIKVIVPEGTTLLGGKPNPRRIHVGYIKRQEAVVLAPWIDKGGKARWVYRTGNVVESSAQ